jgi:hypothetical protein
MKETAARRIAPTGGRCPEDLDSQAAVRERVLDQRMTLGM